LQKMSKTFPGNNRPFGIERIGMRVDLRVSPHISIQIRQFAIVANIVPALIYSLLI